MAKTNAIRILEAKKIDFTTHDYISDDVELDAITVANKIGADPYQVFKTLVTVSDKNDYFVFVIPGPDNLNLKKAAKTAGRKKIEMLPLNKLQPLTGYIRGGCTSIGMKKNFPVYIESSAQNFDKIYVSAGKRGTQIYIAPDDLLGAANAEYSEVV